MHVGNLNQRINLQVKIMSNIEKITPEVQSTDILNFYGLSEVTQLSHALAFIANRGLMDEFIGHTQKLARKAQSAAQNLQEVTETLEYVGYTVANSEFGKPYWEFRDEASTDFHTKDEAWLAAWTDAQNRVVNAVASAGYTRDLWDGLSLTAQLNAVRKNLVKFWDMHMHEAADTAFENYDFGDLTVAAANGWESSSDSSTMVRTVFLQDPFTPEAPSMRYRFAVEVSAGNEVSASLNK